MDRTLSGLGFDPRLFSIWLTTMGACSWVWIERRQPGFFLLGLPAILGSGLFQFKSVAKQGWENLGSSVSVSAICCLLVAIFLLNSCCAFCGTMASAVVISRILLGAVVLFLAVTERRPMSILRMMLLLGLTLGACTTFNQENYTVLTSVKRSSSSPSAKDYSYDAVVSVTVVPLLAKNQLEEEW